MRVTVGRKFRTASHCVRSIFVSRNKFIGIGSDTDAADYKKKSGCGKETFDQRALCLVYAKADEQANGIYEYDYCEVICDLDMIRLYLHAEGEGEKDCSEDCFREPLFP